MFPSDRELKKHFIFLIEGKREGKRNFIKSENFPSYMSHIDKSTEKIEKTRDDSENGASLSQISRRCPPLFREYFGLHIYYLQLPNLQYIQFLTVS